MKRLLSFFLALLLLAALPVAALAAESITVSLSATKAEVGDEITVSGTAMADTWVTLEGTDSDGNIQYFSAVLSDASGAYSKTLVIPDMDDGTLTITAGNSSMTASAKVTIYTPTSSGGGSASSSVTTTSSTVSIYDSESGKTASVAFTSTTDSSKSTTTAVVTAQNVASLIDVAKSSDEGLTGISAIKINVASTETVKTVSVSIPAASFQELVADTDADIEINTSLGTIIFNAKATNSIGNAGSTGTLCIRMNQAETDTLSKANQVLVGSRPVYELSVTSGSTTISKFGGGTATVSIPYSLPDGEDLNCIIIYYLSASGKLVMVPNCVYAADTGMVTFTTTHFSTFAVGYNKVSFSDVSDSAWYVDYVDFLSARGIVGGNNGAFSPDASITRAEVVTILARMSGDDLSGYTVSALTDVTTSDWYFAAVQWAYEKGITTGSDGKFNPNTAITREQMATMLYRYADYTGDMSNAEGMSARKFTDYDSISSWAQAAIQWAVKNGIITGNPDGSFAPASNATRAEAAKMIAVLPTRIRLL